MGCASCTVNQKWVFLASLSVAALASSLCDSIQAPFYPQEAEKKGASATEYGLVFGIYELVGIFFGPVCGKYVGRVNPGRMLKGGILLSGVSTTLFGFLDWINDHTWFISLSFLLRIAESLGASAILTSTLSIVAVVYFEAYARVFSVIEILRGLGIILGPTFGGILFELGEFQLPFFVVGVSVLVSGILITMFLPQTDYQKQKDKPAGDVWPVIKIGVVFADMFSLAAQSMTVVFIETTMEPHLRPFGLSPSLLGAMFIIHPIIYSTISPVVGILCDKGFSLRLFSITGSLFTIAGVLLVGPVPYTPLETSLLMVGVGMGILGLGMALVFVPSMIDANYTAVQHGLGDDATTYGTVAGIIISAYSLGAFIGPTAAGVLVDTVGFRKGTLFLIAINMFAAILMSWMACTEKGYVKINETDHPSTHTARNFDFIVPRTSSQVMELTFPSPQSSDVPILTARSNLNEYDSIEHDQTPQ